MLDYNNFIKQQEERIVVTLTSYKKRIRSVVDTLISLKNQSKQAYKIVLNLATDEFPKKEKELPDSLLNFKEDCPTFEIFWVKENVTFFKKLIPTLKRYPNDIVITTDDDIIYPEDFIESLYKTYLVTGKKHPVTSGKYTWNRGINSHFGSGSLVKLCFFGDKLYELYDKLTYPLIKNKIQCFDDVLYTYAILLNDNYYVYCDNGLSDIWEVTRNKQEDAFTKFGDNKQEKEFQEYHKEIMKYIIKTYNKTYADLCKRKQIII
ncbi:hypothetical protein [uncultured Methanobrevibacter sp.]|uniref:hypothetical protein n=1 Tax=uncultured Methanobrevibacter sp. TaxID=253161 RepID=UPI0025DCDB9B|nr:hypothetical protein [uncultured Methanobrevibacter sp.]